MRKRHVFQVGRHVFVPHPEVRGAWLRTDSSILLAACGYCGAKKGQPCRGKTPSGITAGTHSDRRMAANAARRRIERRARAERAATIMHVEVPL